MDTLDQLADAFLTHHRAVGSSASTVRHYSDSMRLLRRCFQDEGIAADATSLTSHNMNVFAGWLRTTPTRVWRDKTERSIYGVHGALKDVKAFLRWCMEDGLIAAVPKVPIPRLPQNLFPILTEIDLELIFHSTYLSGNSELAIRNRALVAFMLDTGVRLSEASGLSMANLNIRAGEAKIRGKGNKERMVYFTESVADILKRWIAVRGEDP
ncbi:MAG: tyrosine-type recombinase/integrase, partial [Thermomicrobiales bacterium]